MATWATLKLRRNKKQLTGKARVHQIRLATWATFNIRRNLKRNKMKREPGCTKLDWLHGQHLTSDTRSKKQVTGKARLHQIRLATWATINLRHKKQETTHWESQGAPN